MGKKKEDTHIPFSLYCLGFKRKKKKKKKMMRMGAESNGNCFQIGTLFNEDFSPPPRYPGSKQSRQQANVKPTLRVGKWSG